MAIITDEHREFFRHNGYVVVKNVIPKENCERVIAAIWEFLGKDPNDRDAWYTPPKGMDDYDMKTQRGGWAPMFHHQSLWDNRQHPNVYRAFAELLNEDKLMVSIDQVAAKLPYRKGYEILNNSFIHWDMNTLDLPTPLVRPMGVQGLIMLADTHEDTGGFRCVPSLYRDMENWLARQPADRHPKNPEDLEGYEIVKVLGEAGDLVIWDKLLAHGNGENHSNEVRFAQFVTMRPAPRPESMTDEQKARQQSRIQAWQTNSGLGTDPRQWETKNYDKPAELTPLGRKLLGVDSWYD
ncbi:phytanoyl-CoA dioxygenase family protein [Phycisphaerales bacterium AB-hyl4]|uniref:Phytanoyl-CoA dioxygenase family protein n=1 Tax=Natronomicrosphaera hydrolytica TaxID=3242702 RepID=A0ABV4U444_9BACT